MSAELTEQELREAAAEAGISPEELRRELVKHAGGVPEPAQTGPGNTGISTYKAESNLQLPPEHATEAVRRAIERLVGARGHRQGEGKASVVDEARGVSYHVQSTGDGRGGALVRVDVDPMAGAGSMALSGFMYGSTALAMLTVGLLVGLSAITGVGVLLGLVGAFVLYRRREQLLRGRAEAQSVVAQALLEAEDAPAASGPRALPPDGRPALPPGAV